MEGRVTLTGGRATTGLCSPTPQKNPSVQEDKLTAEHFKLKTELDRLTSSLEELNARLKPLFAQPEVSMPHQQERAMCTKDVPPTPAVCTERLMLQQHAGRVYLLDASVQAMLSNLDI